MASFRQWVFLKLPLAYCLLPNLHTDCATPERGVWFPWLTV